MKPARNLTLCFLAALVLGGCETRDAVPPAPTPVDTTPIKEAAAKVDAAAEKVNAAQRDIDTGKAKAASKAAAAVNAAGYANQRNPEGPPKEATAGEIGEAAKWLPPPTGEDAAEAMRRVNLVLTGQRDEARAAYAKSDSERIAANAAAAKAQTEREAALRERDAARQEQRDTTAKIQATADARVNAYRIESETRIREADAKAERATHEANAAMLRNIFFPLAGVFALAFAVQAWLAWVRDSAHLWGSAGVCGGLAIVFASIPFAVGAFIWIAGAVIFALLSTLFVVVIRANRKKQTDDQKAADDALAAKAMQQVFSGIQNAKTAIPDAAASVLAHVRDATGPEVQAFIRNLKSAV